jgi:hypothetical protein
MFRTDGGERSDQIDTLKIDTLLGARKSIAFAKRGTIYCIGCDCLGGFRSLKRLQRERDVDTESA